VKDVTVSVTDLEPMMRFIAKVAQADGQLRQMTKEQFYALPDCAIQGMGTLQEALMQLDKIGLLKHAE